MVKSFLEGYALHYWQLRSIEPTDTAEYAAKLADIGSLHEDLITELTARKAHSSANGDPVLLTAQPEMIVKAIPSCIPTFVETGQGKDIIEADLAGHRLWFTTLKKEGEWEIRSIALAPKKEVVATAGIDGEWEYTGNNNVYTFSLKVESRGNEIRGWICALADHGNRIDCMLEEDGISFTGTWDGRLGNLNVVSAYSGKSGKATLSLPDSLLQWNLTEDPEGEDFLLREGTLRKLGGIK